MLQFNRFPELTTAVARRLLGAVCTHFYDDFAVVEPAVTAGSAQWALAEIHRAVGFPFADKKHVPAAAVNLASDRRARVDVRVGAAPESYFGGNDDVIKSKPAVVEDDACAFHEVLEVPVARGAERTLRVSLVEVGATYDSVLAAAAIPLEDLEPAPSRKGTRTVAATLDLAPEGVENIRRSIQVSLSTG